MDATWESRSTFANVLCVLREDIFFEVFEMFEACQLDRNVCAGLSV